MAKVIPLDKAENSISEQLSALNLGSTDWLDDIIQGAKESFRPRYIKFEFKYLPDYLIEIGKEKESKASKFFKEVFQPKAYVLLQNGNAYVYDFKENKTRKITPDIRIFQPSPIQKALSSPLGLMTVSALVFLTLAFAFKGLRDTLKGE